MWQRTKICRRKTQSEQDKASHKVMVRELTPSQTMRVEQTENKRKLRQEPYNVC